MPAYQQPEAGSLNKQEELRMADKLDQIERMIKGKEGWHVAATERYGTLYVSVFKWWWRKPEWLDGLMERMEINQRMEIDRFWHFGYGIKDCRLSSSDDIALGFIAAINAAESLPVDASQEDRTGEGMAAMYSQVPHFGPEISGQGSMG
jgi:hypothetical protein